MKRIRILTRLAILTAAGAMLAASSHAAPEPAKAPTPTAAAAAHFLAPDAIDLAAVLPPPPAPGSLAAEADLQTVLHVQESRTPEQIAWARFVEDDDLFKNARVLGAWFTKENLPRTAAFFAQIDDDGYAVSRAAKARFPRPRPPVVDARVHPCVALPKSGSYPSGHSSQAWMWAGLLAEIFPEQRAALFERARAVEWARVIGGVHFPTDTAGGRRLAEAIVAAFLKNPAVQAEIARCRAEAEPFLLRKAA